MSKEPLVLYNKNGPVVTVTLNRPEKLNAITHEFHHQLNAALRKFNDDPETYIVVLNANGRAFCAGRDIAAQAQSSSPVTHGLDPETTQFGVIPVEKLVITSCRGHAIGVGGYMAMYGDVRVVSETFNFALMELPTAMLGPYWIGQEETLPRAVAFRLAVGDRFTTDELKHWGLVTEVVPDAQLESATQRWVDYLLSLPRRHLLETKRLMKEIGYQYSRETYKKEMDVRAHLDSLNDTREAALAFVEKRKPKFTGS
ncbi:enoyl-CoA hydratase/isomerase family protein [Candidatus Binatus sp.]|uniref:enoyl-CoA hydratase/isomerase family protein n=1 Tax=Candidatus Binatus sp. TaxID=2811406 RepID=UPI003C7243BC